MAALSDSDVVIVEAVRSPLGKRNGGLSTLHPADLLGAVLFTAAVGAVVAGTCLYDPGHGPDGGSGALPSWALALLLVLTGVVLLLAFAGVERRTLNPRTVARKKLIVANLKMYKTPDETREFFRAFLPLVRAHLRDEITVCQPFISVPAAVEAARGSQVGIGAQDLFWEKEGAYTGEI